MKKLIIISLACLLGLFIIMVLDVSLNIIGGIVYGYIGLTIAICAFTVLFVYARYRDAVRELESGHDAYNDIVDLSEDRLKEITNLQNSINSLKIDYGNICNENLMLDQKLEACSIELTQEGERLKFMKDLAVSYSELYDILDEEYQLTVKLLDNARAWGRSMDKAYRKSLIDSKGKNAFLWMFMNGNLFKGAQINGKWYSSNDYFHWHDAPYDQIPEYIVLIDEINIFHSKLYHFNGKSYDISISEVVMQSWSDYVSKQNKWEHNDEENNIVEDSI